MALGNCHYCGAPAIGGYPDVPSSRHCADCYLTRQLHGSIADLRQTIRTETRTEPLLRAYRHEILEHHRSTMVNMLRARLRRLGVEFTGHVPHVKGA